MKQFILLLTLVLSISLQGQTVLFSENFDGTIQAVRTYAANSNNTWSLTNTLQNSGTHSDSAVVIQSDSLFLETDLIDASAFSFVELSFDHICKIDFFDGAAIQLSVDSGISWTTLTTAEYLGNGTLFQDRFSAISYSAWQASQGSATPTNSWWRTEQFDLSALAANASKLKIRFVLVDEDNTGAMGNYGWLVDNIEVIGSACETVDPSIQLTSTNFQGIVYSTGPFLIQADVQDASGIDTVELAYSVNNGPKIYLQMQNTSGNNYEVNIPAMTAGDSICYFIRAKDATTCGGNESFYPTNSCISFIVKNTPPPICQGTPVFNFDYLETFASFTPGNGTNTPGSLNNNWVNETGDDHDWWVYDNATSSTATGPTSDHSLNDANYLYVEASSRFNQTAILSSPCYDLSGTLAPKLGFWYHMYGTNMGSLEVEVYHQGRWWQLLPTISGDQGNQWNYITVDLSNYVGSFIKIRFVATTGSNFRSDIAIDDIEIFEPPANEVALKGVFSPSPLGCSGSAQEYLTVTIKNEGRVAQSVIPMAYQLNSGAVVRDTLRMNLQPAAQANFTFQQTVNMSSSGSYSFNIWHELSTDADNNNDSIINYLISSRPSSINFPDTTNFESFTVGAPGLFANGWENNPNDFHDWYVHQSNTPSLNTGPAGDHTSGFGKYIYIEASTFTNQETSVLSKCYDINNLNKPELKFSYHMLGQDMGDLHLDISVNGIFIQDIMPVISGNQGSSWNDQIVDLSPFKGVVKLIFRGKVGNDYRSDIAIDDVIVYDAQPVGIGELSGVEKVDWEIYPNPTNGNFTISGLNSNTRLKIYNSMGEIVHSSMVLVENEVLKINHLSNGLYFVEAIEESKRSVKRLIVH
ncbi:MAG: hypothetical protein CMC96_14210 [Flavobacteriales bacterium]|nr:hypothetical protein [Flavobacteriales bacterium]|tara:strand:- start:2983 stop:5574 length:2592 start_codon:yes stop_codon:yes gene_type:complete